MAGKAYKKADEIQIDGNKIFSPVRRMWLSLSSKLSGALPICEKKV